MVDKDIISVKILHVNECLGRLQEKKNIKKELFLRNKDAQDIVLHNLQTAIQGCIDIASHIISDEQWQIPGNVTGLFDVLKERKVINAKTSEILRKMAGFRNIIVHEYEDIDFEKVYDIFKNCMPDFKSYLKQIILFTRI